jgi:hypothetical protein
MLHSRPHLTERLNSQILRTAQTLGNKRFVNSKPRSQFILRYTTFAKCVPQRVISCVQSLIIIVPYHRSWYSMFGLGFTIGHRSEPRYEIHNDKVVTLYEGDLSQKDEPIFCELYLFQRATYCRVLLICHAFVYYIQGTNPD